MDDKVKVRFTLADSPYTVGEEKDCSAEEAAKLVRNGVAEMVDATECKPAKRQAGMKW